MKSKLKRGDTVDNVITISRPKDWVQHMTYSELLAERAFMRQEKKRVRSARNICSKIDPRGMWSETYDVDDILEDMIECCDFVIKKVSERMIELMKAGQ